VAGTQGHWRDGSSTATWQISDPAYAKLFGRHAAILFTEDDLLWYRLKPTPKSKHDFTYGDQNVAFAERHRKHVPIWSVVNEAITNGRGTQP
jgi:GH35 family endo-1,4-beta-xylanase